MVEGFAAMRERLVCEERLKPEAPGTKPCFPCSLEKISGASRLLIILEQCAGMLVCGEAIAVSLVDSLDSRFGELLK
jgi:hypothetical protein